MRAIAKHMMDFEHELLHTDLIGQVINGLEAHPKNE